MKIGRSLSAHFFVVKVSCRTYGFCQQSVNEKKGKIVGSPPKDLKLDIFPHIFPQAFFERMKGLAGGNPALAGSIMRWLNIPVLWDLDARLRMMMRFPGYRQI